MSDSTIRSSAAERRANRDTQRDTVIDMVHADNPDAVIVVGPPFGHPRPQWMAALSRSRSVGSAHPRTLHDHRAPSHGRCGADREAAACLPEALRLPVAATSSTDARRSTRPLRLGPVRSPPSCGPRPSTRFPQESVWLGNWPLTRPFALERVTGIEPAWPAWKISGRRAHNEHNSLADLRCHESAEVRWVTAGDRDCGHSVLARGIFWARNRMTSLWRGRRLVMRPGCQWYTSRRWLIRTARASRASCRSRRDLARRV